MLTIFLFQNGSYRSFTKFHPKTNSGPGMVLRVAFVFFIFTIVQMKTQWFVLNMRVFNKTRGFLLLYKYITSKADNRKDDRTAVQQPDVLGIRS